METKNFLIISEEDIKNQIDKYFTSISSNKNDKDNILEKTLSIEIENTESHNLLINLFLILLEESIKFIGKQNDIKEIELYYNYLIEENRLSIVFESIFLNLAEISKNNFNKNHIFKELLEKSNLKKNFSSDINIEFLLHCDILKYINYDMFYNLYSISKVQILEVEKRLYKRLLKGIYYYVN